MATKKRGAKKRGSQKRELIEPGTDDRYVKRNPKGQFKESDDVGKSLPVDRRTNAKKEVKAGYGDQGDQPKRGTKKSTKKAATKK